MKRLFIVFVSLCFAAPACAASLEIVNKTNDKIKVRVVGPHMREYGWFDLNPGKGKWFYGEASDIYGRSMKDPRAIPGPLEFTFLEGKYKGKTYRSRHFFSVPKHGNWKMWIYDYSSDGMNTPGVHLKEPWIYNKSGDGLFEFMATRSFKWPATEIATSGIATREH